MGKKKFYAVKTGRKTGIYLSWDACKAQITGYSGAVYKGFETEDEARLFLSDSRIEKELSEDALVAYVDGGNEGIFLRYGAVGSGESDRKGMREK